MGVTSMVILFLWVCSRSVRSSASQRQQWTALRSGSSPRSTPAERQGLPRCRRIGFRGSATSSAQTSASLHPPAALRLRVLPFTRDMVVHGLCGRVPDSAGSIICHPAAAPWPGAAFLQITARTNPCSRHLWGTLARAVASICAHRAR